jgi:hypothetical protein
VCDCCLTANEHLCTYIIAGKHTFRQDNDDDVLFVLAQDA